MLIWKFIFLALLTVKCHTETTNPLDFSYKVKVDAQRESSEKAEKPFPADFLFKIFISPLNDFFTYLRSSVTTKRIDTHPRSTPLIFPTCHLSEKLNWTLAESKIPSNDFQLQITPLHPVCLLEERANFTSIHDKVLQNDLDDTEFAKLPQITYEMCLLEEKLNYTFIVDVFVETLHSKQPQKPSPQQDTHVVIWPTCYDNRTTGSTNDIHQIIWDYAKHAFDRAKTIKRTHTCRVLADYFSQYIPDMCGDCFLRKIISKLELRDIITFGMLIVLLTTNSKRSTAVAEDLSMRLDKTKNMGEKDSVRRKSLQRELASVKVQLEKANAKVKEQQRELASVKVQLEKANAKVKEQKSGLRNSQSECLRKTEQIVQLEKKILHQQIAFQKKATSRERLLKTPVPPYLFPQLGEEGTFMEKSRFVGRQIFRYLEGRPAYLKRPVDQPNDHEVWQFESKYRSLVEQQEKYLATQFILYQHRYPVDYSQLLPLSKKQVQEIVIKNLHFFEEHKTKMAYLKYRGKNEHNVEQPFSCYDVDLADLPLTLRKMTAARMENQTSPGITPPLDELSDNNWQATRRPHNPYVWKRK